MKPSSKRLTLWQIADLAGTSKSTVSRVLTNDPHVSEETRRRIQAVIQERGFQPNLFARGLRGGRTGQIAVIGRWMERGFIADVIRGIDDVAGRNDAHVLSCFAHSTEDFIALWRKFAQSGQVDGTVLIAPPTELLAHEVDPGDVPVVLCACQAPNSRKGWKGVDTVMLDNRKAIEEMLKHLLDQGCRHIVHMAGSADIYETRERARIFSEYLDRFPGLQTEIIPVPETREMARLKTFEYLKDHDQKAPDVFFCFNDDIAIGVILALKEAGIQVPAQTAVTGFDDDELAEFVGLTTIHVPMVLIGQEAMRLLLLRLNESEESRIARHTLIELILKVRSSSMIREARGAGAAAAAG